jgi:hypothetical protein
VGDVVADASQQELQGKYRQFQRVLMSYIDFNQAHNISVLILEMKLHEKYPKENRILLEALNLAMIVAYCRPFSGNDGKTAMRVPDLPDRFLRYLSNDEREIHDAAMEDRNRVLAHSDSDAWQMTPHYVQLTSREILVPAHRGVHRPLLLEPTIRLSRLAGRMREMCYAERLRLEQELKPYLPRAESADKSN